MRKQVGVGIVLATVSVWVQAQTYQPQVPTFNETSLKQRVKNNPWKDIGTVTLAGKTLPAFAVSVRSPVEDGFVAENDDCRPKACVLSAPVKLPSERLHELMALRVAGIGWILAPKTWRDVEADVGVNGSQAILLRSPNGREYLSYYHSGACVGCALTAAAPFFPQAFKQAKSYDYEPENPNPSIKLVRSQNNKVLFSYALPSQHTTHGVAFWQPNDDEPFRDMRVTVNPSNTGLAGVILNAGVMPF